MVLYLVRQLLPTTLGRPTSREITLSKQTAGKQMNYVITLGKEELVGKLLDEF